MMSRARRMLELQKQDHYTGLNIALFCAMAIEAYLNDFTLILQLTLTSNSKPEVTAASSLMNELSESKVSLFTKYELLYYVLTRRPLPKGDSVWENFRLLMTIRNTAVHYKSSITDYIPVSPEHKNSKSIRNLITVLKNKKLLIRKTHLHDAQWSMLLDESVPFSEWAIKTTQDVVLTIHSAIPDPEVQSLFSGLVKPGESWLMGYTPR